MFLVLLFISPIYFLKNLKLEGWLMAKISIHPRIFFGLFYVRADTKFDGSKIAGTSENSFCSLIEFSRIFQMPLEHSLLPPNYPNLPSILHAPKHFNLQFIDWKLLWEKKSFHYNRQSYNFRSLLLEITCNLLVLHEILNKANGMRLVFMSRYKCDE